MKKNRPGQVLHILCQSELQEKVRDYLFKETTTLGIRFIPYHVYRLERSMVKVDTKWGEAHVKVGRYKGTIVQISPEYEDCKRIARQHDISISLVYDTVKQLAELSQ